MNPLWTPNKDHIKRTRMRKFMDKVSYKTGFQFDSYSQFYQWSIAQSEDFWSLWWDEADIISSNKGTPVLSESDIFSEAQWFNDAKLNFAENLLRYQDNKTALIGTDERGEIRRLSYHELFLEVASVASAMQKQGIAMGDRVAGYMPNIIETVVAMLAATSLGAIWSSCSPDFGLNGVCDRFSQIKPKLLITTDGYFYNGKMHSNLQQVSAISAAIDSIEKLVIVNYMDPDSSLKHIKAAVRWDNFVDSSATDIKFVQTLFNHPLYIMYSSGTTGKPKCIVHGAGGTLLQHSKEHLLHTDISRDDVLFYFTTCGWMMWHWLVSGLYSGCQVVLYDGSPFAPEKTSLIDLIDRTGITVFGTSAKYLSTLNKENIQPQETHNLSSLRTILSTGSPLSPENFDYVYQKIKSDVLLGSISGGTDIISCFALTCPLRPVYAGQLQCRGLGMDVKIYDENGRSIQDKKGELVCVKPFPSMPVGFWNDDDGSQYQATYFARFPGVWAHGDFAELTAEDGIVIYGRSDSILNPGGVRIGTAEIYQQLEKMPEVVEALAIAQKWGDDVRIVLFVILTPGLNLNDALSERIKLTIQKNTTVRHVPSRIIAVPDIPRTLSGKIAETAVQKCVHHEEINNKEALSNPHVLNYFQELGNLEARI